MDIDGPITVIGSGQTLHLGDWVTTGGGAYDMSDFSVTGVEILSAECAGGGWWLATNPAGPLSDP